MRLPRALQMLALLVLAGPSLLEGQAVRGRLVEEGSDAPVVGALLILEDSAGTQVAQAASGVAGRFLLRASQPGALRLRVLRIGYAPWQDRLVLAPGETLDRTITLSGLPILLPEITVAGTPMPATFGRSWRSFRRASTGTCPSTTYPSTSAVWQVWTERGTAAAALTSDRSSMSTTLTWNPLARRYSTHFPQHPQEGDLYTVTTDTGAAAACRVGPDEAAPSETTAPAARTSGIRRAMRMAFSRRDVTGSMGLAAEFLVAPVPFVDHPAEQHGTEGEHEDGHDRGSDEGDGHAFSRDGTVA